MNLSSSVNEVGKTVTQIVHFSDGGKKTFNGVIADSIYQSEFTRFDLISGLRVYVNTKNVNFFECFDEK